MLFSNAQKFIDKVQRWMSVFSVAYWVLALMPLGIFSLMVMLDPPVRDPLSGFLILFGMIFYVAIAFLVKRLCMITFEFMKSVVAAVLDCHQELKEINESLNSLNAQKDSGSASPSSPYNF